jgi:superfamily I DNA/RNA helicase
MKRLKFKPTEEQVHSRSLTLDGEHLKIEAYAGASKTTTCIICACALPDERGNYLAFNSSIAKHASTEFPDNVKCMTTHSLAFRAVGVKYVRAGRELPHPKKRRLRGGEIASILGVKEGYKSENVNIHREGIAYLAKEMVTRFCYSADEKIGFRHFPFINGMDKWNDTEKQEVKALVTHFADVYWQDITALSGRLDFEHDHYLKMYQLEKPYIDVDFLMLDEGQDTNPATLDIFERQGDHAQLIMVGDRYQSIYQWRGAVDAMSEFDAPASSHLTKSFRFGEGVAGEANKWLTLLGADAPLVGFEQIDSKVHAIEEPTAIICRTNAQVIAETLAAQDNGKKVYVQGGTREIEEFAKGARDLMHTGSSTHPELIGFKGWNDVQTFVATDKGAKDLKLFVKLIDDYGVERVLNVAVTAVSKQEYADVVTTTGHKSKGREYEKVRIGADFQPPEPDENGELKLDHSEMRLAYVSVTRAQKELDCTALEWVDRWVAMHNAEKAKQPPVTAAA